MDIHIHNQIEFEKILDYSFPESISLTRQRISIQQFLDQKDSDSTDNDNEKLIKHLTQYTKDIKALIRKLPETVLEKQPCFSWSVDHEELQTACWLFEAIMPTVVNFQLHVELGNLSVQEEQYKAANKHFKKAETLAKDAESLATSWKWKLPYMNHKIMEPSWHKAQQLRTETLQQLCTISVGIQNETNSKVMYTISQRALRAASLSYMQWKTKHAEELIKIADGLRYMYSSNILWNREEYGHSIYRLENWILNRSIETGFWRIFDLEFQKIPFLLQERHHTNNGAYFDAVKQGFTLPNIEEIIRTKNTKHPEKGLNSEPTDEDQPLNLENLT
jgi:hypothetical protein